ncbi:MCP four helix bundle domain-containing protein, partial [Palleronia sp.]|uniref:MCP four helix bundle domain-containing protein n=1 Tax=Palleronia sp. TaxID=1940284 RepID=UPI0035C78F60
MHMTIKARLIATFVVLVALIGVSSFIALKEAGKLHANLNQMADNTAYQLDESLKIEANAARSMSLIKSYLAQPDADVAGQIAGQVDQQITDVGDAVTNIANSDNGESTSALRAAFDKEWREFLAVEAELRPLGLANTNVRATRTYMDESEPAFDALYAQTEKMIGDLRSRIAAFAARAARDARLEELETNIDAMTDNIRGLQSIERQMLILVDGESLAAKAAEFADQKEGLIENLASAELNASGADLATVNTIRALWQAWEIPLTQTVDLSLRNTNTLATEILNERLEPAFKESFAAADALATRARVSLEAAQVEAQQAYQNSRNLLLTLGAAAVVVAIAAAFWLSTTISRGLGRAVDVVTEVARGNLDVEAKTKSRDEIGTLLNAMNGMVGDLKGMSHAAESIAKGDLRANVT